MRSKRLLGDEMTRPSKQVTFDDQTRPDYKLLDEIVKRCGGWIRSSGPDGESVEIWHDDTEYVFRGEALIRFLYAVKDNHVSSLYAAKDLIEYIEKSASVPPSVFTRDAIIHRAQRLKAQIEGTS